MHRTAPHHKIAAYTGFTLAELLIALAILGVIATFTIPKVLQSQQDSRYNAVMKETVAAVSGAFEAYKAANTLSANTRISDLTPYLNYVRPDTSGQADNRYGLTGFFTCNGWDQCLRLHSGAVIIYRYGSGTLATANSFGGTTKNNFISFSVDPDGQPTSSSATGPGKSMQFLLYYDGRISHFSQCKEGDVTYMDSALQDWCPNAELDPPYFSWN